MAGKIISNLWFTGNAREAVDYYLSVFPGAKITGGSKYPEGSDDGLADFQKDFAGKDLTNRFQPTWPGFHGYQCRARVYF